MAEFEEQLGAILGDSEAMGKIMALAQSLSGPPAGEGVQDNGEQLPPSPSLPREAPDERLLAALRPYLRPERQRGLDRGLEILRLLRLMKGTGQGP